nr:hypothetical protein [Vibrio vulnificus]
MKVVCKKLVYAAFTP